METAIKIGNDVKIDEVAFDKMAEALVKIAECSGDREVKIAAIEALKFTTGPSNLNLSHVHVVGDNRGGAEVSGPNVLLDDDETYT